MRIIIVAIIFLLFASCVEALADTYTTQIGNFTCHSTIGTPRHASDGRIVSNSSVSCSENKEVEYDPTAKARNIAKAQEYLDYQKAVETQNWTDYCSKYPDEPPCWKQGGNR